jgi:formylglycine-generating enzyme required for sulfatase activity
LEPVPANGVLVNGVTKPPVPPPPSDPFEGMVLIPAGEFRMGSNDAESGVDEQPVHTVHVDAFYMDKYEVTNLDYKRFVLANPQWQKSRIRRSLHSGDYLKHWNGNNYPAGKANHPVTYMSWYAAMAYSAWAGKRLPTEAEWEKAARGGKSGLKYPWGNTISNGRANYGNHVKDTRVVGSYAANGYGLYDMAGNVWEWCLDAYDANFYFSSPRRNPLGGVNTLSNADLIINDYTNVKSSRVVRGGSWYNPARNVRVANRFNYTPPFPNFNFGFRCARSVSP